MALIDVFIIDEAKRMRDLYSVNFGGLAPFGDDQYQHKQKFDRALQIFAKYGIEKTDEDASWIRGTSSNPENIVDAALEFLPGAVESKTTDKVSRESILLRLSKNEGVYATPTGVNVWDGMYFSVSPPTRKKSDPSRVEQFFAAIAAGDGMTKHELHLLWLELAGKDYGEFKNTQRTNWMTKKTIQSRQRRYKDWGRSNVQMLIDAWLEEGPDGKYRIRGDTTPQTPYFRDSRKMDFAKSGFGIDDGNE
jgi:hypothetical protein